MDVAALYYVEPFLTDDCDVFVYLPASGSILTLSPIYQQLASLGYYPEGPFVVIEGTKVQFLPITTPLVQEAFDNAVTVTMYGDSTNIFSVEYLMAICVETTRPRDRYKVGLFLEQATYDKEKLEDILHRYNLINRWETWTVQ